MGLRDWSFWYKRHLARGRRRRHSYNRRILCIYWVLDRSIKLIRGFQDNSDLTVNNRTWFSIWATFWCLFLVCHVHKKLFTSKLISRNVKLQLYNTLIRPTVTYTSETWVHGMQLEEGIIENSWKKVAEQARTLYRSQRFIRRSSFVNRFILYMVIALRWKFISLAQAAPQVT